MGKVVPVVGETPSSLSRRLYPSVGRELAYRSFAFANRGRAIEMPFRFDGSSEWDYFDDALISDEYVDSSVWREGLRDAWLGMFESSALPLAVESERRYRSYVDGGYVDEFEGGSQTLAEDVWSYVGRKWLSGYGTTALDIFTGVVDIGDLRELERVALGVPGVDGAVARLVGSDVELTINGDIGLLFEFAGA